MKNGLIYIFVKFILEKLKLLNLVEGFKYIGLKLNPQKNNLHLKLCYERTSVDIFIILKWILLYIIAKNQISNDFLTVSVWYLLLTNLYTYFYYHIWNDSALNTEDFEKDRVRRRFINLILAVGYSNFCFAYLYRLPYENLYNWSENTCCFTKAIWYSVSNSLAANYNEVNPKNDFANNVAMTQLIVTFIFITIILGKSLPQTNSDI